MDQTLVAAAVTLHNFPRTNFTLVDIYDWYSLVLEAINQWLVDPPHGAVQKTTRRAGAQSKKRALLTGFQSRILARISHSFCSSVYYVYSLVYYVYSLSVLT
ncbi:hypothetical protein ILYODFUR_015207 [Ilyodon furcidens]|uniref:Uncharacterized protein n=1 Tax=Ilyodon furcidens TaxID=33524 RepID=A0ABV0UV47_9TELE